MFSQQSMMLLAMTYVITFIHVIFDFLAFKVRHVDKNKLLSWSSFFFWILLFLFPPSTTLQCQSDVGFWKSRKVSLDALLFKMISHSTGGFLSFLFKKKIGFGRHLQANRGVQQHMLSHYFSLPNWQRKGTWKFCCWNFFFFFFIYY